MKRREGYLLQEGRGGAAWISEGRARACWVSNGLKSAPMPTCKEARVGGGRLSEAPTRGSRDFAGSTRTSMQ